MRVPTWHGLVRLGRILLMIASSPAQAASAESDARWRDLLHLEPGGRTSEVLPGRFFLAEHGRTDPAAEHAATLAAFREGARGDASAACRYPARFALLLREHDLPAPGPCPAYDLWRASIPATGVTLVYATGFMGRPQSMAGHTFLRLDSTNDGSAALTSPVVNFAALVEARMGLASLVRGAVGGHVGRFNVLQYHEMVSRYSDLESRDIWEYRLSLDGAELDRMLMHIWELRDAEFAYRFLDENCSYHLLALLDVARPGLRLRDRFRHLTIPGETVRVIATVEELVESRAFRPSLATRVLAVQDRASEADRARVIAIADGSQAVMPGLPDRVVEAAHALVEHRWRSGRCGPQECLPRLRSLSLIYPASAAEQTVGPTGPGSQPEASHGHARLDLGVGTHTRGAEFLEVRGRMALHGALEPPAGYLTNSEIIALDLRLARFDGSWKIGRLDLVALESTAPSDVLGNRPAWRLNVGWRRDCRSPACDDAAFLVSGLVGRAHSVMGTAVAYALLGPELAFDGTLPGHHDPRIKLATGMLLTGTRLRGRVEVERRASLGPGTSPWHVGIHGEVGLLGNTALRLEFERGSRSGTPSSEWLLAVGWLFSAQ